MRKPPGRQQRSLKMKVSSMRRLVSVSAVAALLVGVAGVAQASPPTAASGTFTQDALTGFEIRFAGPNVMFTQSTAGTFSGSVSGTYEDDFTVVIHPNGKFTAHGTLTCDCTVDGRHGVLEFALTDIGEEIDGVATFAGRMVITGGTGELSDLRGVLEIEGTVDPSSGLSTINYSGELHFHP